MHLKPGTLLKNGTYRIVRFINSGGFGCTYEAVHTSLDDRFAIKEFFVKDFCNRDENTSYVTVGTNSKKALVEKLKNKFINEAKSIRKLHHNGIVKVSDVFEENGTAYYVMDYIEGRSLSQLIDDKGRLTETETMRYIRKISETLKYVHSKNMLHLDIKPGNIMIDEEDNPILIDFGTSKQYDEESGENTSTLLGKTPGYAPLEQMDNSVQEFYPATDIYALGATMYKMLTGITPPNAIKRASGTKLEPLPSNISEGTRNAIETSLNILVENRPQSIDEFLRSLEFKKVTEDEGTDIEIEVKPDPKPNPTPPPNPVPAPKPTPRPKNWVLYVVVALVLGVGVYIVSDIINKNNAEKERIEAEERAREESESKAQKESMYAAKREYLKMIEEGDKLLSSKKYSESVKKYELALSYEEQYMGTEYSKEFDKGASSKIKAANEAERAYKAEQARLEKARLEKERKEHEAEKEKQAFYNRTHGSKSGHDWVDLGLPSGIKWATCNVGASSPEDYGKYYAWGETTTKTEYLDSNSKTYDKSISDIRGSSQYDAARSNWGGSWRLPTRGEMEELKKNCTWSWTTHGGREGYKVTGPNGNSIFLPAAGYRYGTTLDYPGELGHYWSSTPYESDTDYAYSLFFIRGGQNVDRGYRSYGLSVRPVSE